MKTKNLISIGFLIFLIFIIFVFFTFNFVGKINTLPLYKNKFNHTLWLAQDKSLKPKNPRGPMYGDLKENHLPRGMKKDAVIDLLGVPDFEIRENCIAYNLGMWSGFGIDYDSLDICFDAENQLKHVYHLQH